MTKEKFAIDFLRNADDLYLSDNNKKAFAAVQNILPRELALYHIEEVSFEDKAPRKEALENVLSAMKISGINFIYLILGDESGVHFYYGVAKDLSSYENMELSINDIGKYILEPSIKGNFRGSKTKYVAPELKDRIIDKINNMKYYSVLEGVPGSTKDSEKFQCADRLVDVMLGDNFGFMIIAKPLTGSDINKIEKNLYKLYSQIAPLSKKSQQNGSSKNTGSSKSTSKGTSKSNGKTYSEAKQSGGSKSEGLSNGTTKSTGTNSSSSSGSSSNSTSTGKSGSEGSSHSKTSSSGSTWSTSTTQGNSVNESINENVTEGSNTGESSSFSTTLEFVDKEAQDWIKYFDDVIIPRLDYGAGKGIFVTSSFLLSDNKASLKKLENTAMSLYSGETGNKVPLKVYSVINNNNSDTVKFLKNFQVPFGKVSKDTNDNELMARSALSQFVNSNKEFYQGNWITTNELSMIAGLPQKEVVGLSLKEEVEFGLNFKSDIKEKDKIELGKLVQSGNIIDKINVCIDKKNLDKHIFITGVTGSGKTTTCQKILIDSNLPFLIIEPAKTEYRILTKQFDDLMVFTLGKDFVTPFRLNPFEFFAHESITSRVDMIKASIEASFDMEAAIPQIIESAIYACYEDYGWDIATNRNYMFEDPFGDGVYAFPTLSDLIAKVDVVVKQQGFDERLKNDYIGSIKARLQGLLVGSKGLMLNTKRSINFEQLLDKRIVLEFEEIRSASEKSLVMGFVLTNLMEAIKAKFKKQGTFNHITLVEEAHRLLSKFSPGDSPNKKQGVETFADMLAEIRKYGESLIIVDQIPNKLTPEVLKNTNTKIVHKIFAQDDKDAIGNTIVLDKDQKEFLSNLDTGRAIVFTQGFSKAVQVQIDNITNTTSEERIEDEELQNIVYEYYMDNYKSGVIEGIQFLDSKPTLDEFRSIIEVFRDTRIITFFEDSIRGKKDEKSMKLIRDYIHRYGCDIIAKYIANAYYSKKPEGKGRYKKDDKDVLEKLKEFITGYSENKLTFEEIAKYIKILC
ncbi:ATP-binding protein [Clostridium sp. SM-530-WT-3G]|uniref:ATP-binding protein n=1 Tax=Clostridium sp. SM-530-WT-3G TaxID=2725303 RepID=UPI00145DD85E|nr:ATP-binding protein [Clostridium sp. SM-530-WT-3G]NME81603.1 ATP-binding protein [Clostridium sp. SM-530-WT-3G]